MTKQRRVLLVQLPIPPVGPQPIRGNVPLAGGYLKMYARQLGLERDYNIDLLPSRVCNTVSDHGLVQAVLERDPWMVGFTCYLWNIDRTLWIAQRLKNARPELIVVVGGPEVTADNAWVLDHPAVDYAVCGEGEQTFAELLTELRASQTTRPGMPGLHVRRRSLGAPPFRTPMPKLDVVSSPYLEGILDAADEKLLLLETIRGCVFKCKFCYYPKSYDGLYFVSEEKIIANLRHAADRGATEVVLLDPTLNQRKDFDGFLRLLARCNPDHQWTYFGELRGEGIKPEAAKLLREANFTEVEIGLQSVDPHAQELMDRRNALKAFERGAKAMMDVGLHVKVDLIIGLPGDTVESVRRGLKYLYDAGLYHDVQVFQLSILPGTAFRQEATQLGLKYQSRPPYYVIDTPTLTLPEMIDLMGEAQALFGCEFDAPPAPTLHRSRRSIDGPVSLAQIDLDSPEDFSLPAPAERAQAFTLWLRSRDFTLHRVEAASLVEKLLADNPHSTLQLVIEPIGDPRDVAPAFIEQLLAAAQRDPSYLDRFYGMQPGRAQGAKSAVVLAPYAARSEVGPEWIADVGAVATIAWTDENSAVEAPAPMDAFEHLVPTV